MKSVTIPNGETVLENDGDYSILVETGTNATIITTASGNQKFNVVVEQGAQLTMYTLHKNSKCISFGHVKKDAKLFFIDVILEESELDLTTNLEESGAESESLQAFIGNATIKSDVVHKSSHTKSNMHAKGILNDAIGKYTGTIKIESQAAGCVAHQRSDMLLLDEKSRGDSEPILDVNNDDVICSHGATLGQINESQLFYLTSRGLSEELAKQMIVEGFLAPIFEKIPNEKMRDEMVSYVKNGSNN